MVPALLCGQVREKDITARFARGTVFDPEAQTRWENAEKVLGALLRSMRKT